MEQLKAIQAPRSTPLGAEASHPIPTAPVQDLTAACTCRQHGEPCPVCRAWRRRLRLQRLISETLEVN